MQVKWTWVLVIAFAGAVLASLIALGVLTPEQVAEWLSSLNRR